MSKRKVAVITDSTAYLPQYLLEQYGIDIVPLKVHWGPDTYRDGVDLLPAEFCKRIKTDSVTPTTSAPSIGEFKDAFTEALETAESVICILISSKLSATCEAAEQAKALLSGQPIEVIDSRLTAMAMGYVVLAAARTAERGASLSVVAEAARNAIPSARIAFVPDTLEYLRRGGRIGGAAALLGNLMDIKPILELREGRIEVLERARTKKKALERMVESVTALAQSGGPVRLAAIHSGAPDEAQALLETITARIDAVEKMVSDISPVIATHTGPGTVGLTCSVGI